MRALSCLAAVLLFPITLFAQAADRFQPVTARFEKFVEQQEIAGAVLLIGDKDGVKYQQAVGSANLEKKQPMKTDTLFRIASMTKPITAIGIMMLQDEGKLSVDDPVEKHLPEFAGQLMIVDSDHQKGTLTLGKPKRAIRLRDLLTHTSGLAAYPGGLADVYQKRNRTLSETTMVVSQMALYFEPGTKWAYCNSGIDTLGRIIEVVSGQGYEEFLQKRLFDGLKMTETCFFPTEAQQVRLASIYDRKDKKLVVVEKSWLGLEMSAKHPIPAGGLISTAGDLAKLYRMMLHKGELDGVRYLSEKAVAEMTHTQTDDIKTGFVDGMSFGYGWAVVKEPKGVTAMLNAGTYGHGGAFATQGWIDPKAGVSFIMLIQRIGLPNGDASEMRKAFQQLGVEALK